MFHFFTKVILFICLLGAISPTFAGSTEVMDTFNREVIANNPPQVLTEKDTGKHKILFIMGVILLILILLTASFGMAMALHGKELFIPHMIFAGATVFLAIAHAITSIVWFFPY